MSALEPTTPSAPQRAGWVWRPFIGNPAVPFTLFRARNSNFFEAVFIHLRHLFS